MCVGTQSLLKVGGTGADREAWCGRHVSPQSTHGALNPQTTLCRRGGNWPYRHGWGGVHEHFYHKGISVHWEGSSS